MHSIFNEWRYILCLRVSFSCVILLHVGANLLCSPDPCKNGGTCNANSVDSPCLCPSGFTGSFCEGKIVKSKTKLKNSTRFSKSANEISCILRSKQPRISEIIYVIREFISNVHVGRIPTVISVNLSLENLGKVDTHEDSSGCWTRIFILHENTYVTREVNIHWGTGYYIWLHCNGVAFVEDCLSTLQPILTLYRCSWFWITLLCCYSKKQQRVDILTNAYILAFH